jgi:hypothetical protein
MSGLKIYTWLYIPEDQHEQFQYFWLSGLPFIILHLSILKQQMTFPSQFFAAR